MCTNNWRSITLNIRMKKNLIFGLIFVLMISLTFQNPSQTEAAEPSTDVDAPSAILVNADNGKILFEKNADKKRSPASMTKMMTEYLLMDAIEDGDLSWDTKIKINDFEYKLSHNTEFSGIPLSQSATYTVKELYTAMAVESANAATIALARKVAGNEKKFVKRMNKKAKKLGMEHTNYVNSSGLNNAAYSGNQPAGKKNQENMMSAR